MKPAESHMSPVNPTTNMLKLGQSVHLPAKEATLPLGHSLSLSAYPFAWNGSQIQTELSPGETEPDSPTLDISLDNLNQLILELDPTFQPQYSPLQANACRQNRPSTASRDAVATRTAAEEDISYVVTDRGSSPPASHVSSACCHSSSVPIPMHSRARCSPQGSLVFSGSSSPSQLPASSRSNREPSVNSPTSCFVGSPNLLSGSSLLSCSSKSDTSYFLGSCQSLPSDEVDCPQYIFGSTRSYSHTLSPSPISPRHHKPFFSEHDLVKSSKDSHAALHQFQKTVLPPNPSSCPPSVASSMCDIPVVLINGVPQTIPTTRGPQNRSQGSLLEFHNLKKTPSNSSPTHGQLPGSPPSMKFVMDTSQFWFRPHMTREEADTFLQEQKEGSFVVRDSTSYKGSFGLAMKVSEDFMPPSTSPIGDAVINVVRHFLIESSVKGVRLKGSSDEPYFGSLPALVYQHTITARALPCRLRIPSCDFKTKEKDKQGTSETGSTKKAAYNFLYLRSVTTEMLTGPCAIQRAVSAILQEEATPMPTTVNLMVSPKGITLTDIQRKLFFRQYYPAHLLSYCGEDPDNRTWTKDCKTARIFGFVTKGSGLGAENVCHIFAEIDATQSSNMAIELVQGIINDPKRQQ